jgi:hypothetical protein
MQSQVFPITHNLALYSGIWTHMDPKPPSEDKVPPSNQAPGYQPSLGRKLFMLGLCIVGLIIVWTVYLFNR